MDRDAFEDILDELACELPEVFYKELHRGIIVLDDVKAHPEGTGDDLYIMGEYQNYGYMGRAIIIYFGSFMRVYGYMSPEDLKIQMRKTLRHEFRHHMESLAGMRDLEIIDRQDLDEYGKRRKKD